MMQYDEVQELQRRWPGRQCSHSSIVEEYYHDSKTDSLVCSNCGAYLDESYREGFEKDTLRIKRVMECIMN